jgi:acetate kinase
VIAHLGSGASLCALHGGRSVDTTMGMTPLDGLVMATRCGALDPGVVLYLQQARGMTAEKVQDLLYHNSGLLGVSATSPDIRDLVGSNDPHARQAIGLFVARLAKEVAGMVASLGGIDVLVFTGGIGEHQSEIRERVCDRLRFLGVALNPEANRNGGLRVSKADSPAAVLVVARDEEIVIARHTRRVLEE